MIRRQELENQRIDYNGGTHPIAPAGYDLNNPIRHPASMIASAVYGCFLQCRRYGLVLPACLGPKYTKVHGHNDFEKVNKALYSCLADAKSRDLVQRCIEKYFVALQRRPEFAELFEIDISDMIASEENLFYVDLNESEVRFADFFSSHQGFYNEFVNELEQIFAQYTK